jgi:thiazolylpeptide-type bacteriocin precursor
MASIDDVQDNLDKLMRQIFESAHGHLRAIEAVKIANSISTSSSSSSSSSSTTTISTNNMKQPDTIQSLAAEKVEELKITFEELRNQIKCLHGIDISKSELDTKIDTINSEYKVLREEILELDANLDNKTQEIDTLLLQVYIYIFFYIICP